MLIAWERSTKRKGKKPKKPTKQTQTKEPYNQFHNNDSTLVSGMTLHLASSFLFATQRTHASSVICLMLLSLPSCAKAERAPTTIYSGDCKNKAVIFKQIP